MTSRIFVTGAAGFVGSHLVRRLVHDGVEVHILAREGSNLARLEDVRDTITVHRADLTERENLHAALREVRPASVFHLASAGLFGGASISDAELVRANVLGIVNLLDGLADVSFVSFVNVGSSSEYGAKSAPMKESDVCAPGNPYGVTKLAATAYASCAARLQNKPIITLRIFSAYGPDDDPRRLIARVASDLLQGKTPPLANPDAIRDYVYAEDIIDALLEAQEVAPRRPGAIFNLGSGKQSRVGDVVEYVRQQIAPDRALEWGTAPAAPWEPPVWQADMAETFAAFTWRPRHSLEEGLDKTIAWHRARLK